MTFAIAGGAIMDAAQLRESQLERITRKYRSKLRRWFGWLIDTLNQPGTP